MTALTQIKTEIEAWCTGKAWFWRAALLLFFIRLAWMHSVDPAYNGFFGGINLGIHEWGHILFGFSGMFLAIAGGTILQLLAPLASYIMFRRQNDYFGFVFSGVWFATNLYGVALYMADARSQALPLVSPSAGPVIHDWNYLLSATGLLPYDIALAGIVRFIAFIWMWSSIALGIWMIRLMIIHRK